MPVAEVASAFEKLKNSGKVKYFGVSNFSVSQFELLKSALNIPLITNQIEFSPYQLDALEPGVLDHSQINDITIMAWSCLGGGELFKGVSKKSQRLMSALKEVGEEIGADSIDQVAYAWILAHPANIIPLLGSRKIERYQSAVKALQLKLEHEQWYRIWQASVGHGVA